MVWTFIVGLVIGAVVGFGYGAEWREDSLRRWGWIKPERYWRERR